MPADRIEELEAEVARLNREADLQAAEIDKARARSGKWQSMVVDCEEYLKPGETPRQRMDRDRQDVLGLMRLLQMKSEKQEALVAERDALVEALESIADAFGCECGDMARAALAKIKEADNG